MKKIYYFIIGTLAAACVITACSKKEEPRASSGRRQVLSDKKDVESAPSPSTIPASTSYLIRLENETLTLYEITGNEALSLKTINIDPSYYPDDDIRELNRGITAYSKEDGYARLENFVN